MTPRDAAPEALPPSGGNDIAPSLAAASPEAATREQLKEEAVGLATHGDKRRNARQPETAVARTER